MKLYRTIDQSNRVPAVLATMIDTLRACHDRNETVALYRGGGKPHFPVPAVLTMRDASGAYQSAYRWLDNHDGFWNDGPQCRGFSF